MISKNINIILVKLFLIVNIFIVQYGQINALNSQIRWCYDQKSKLNETAIKEALKMISDRSCIQFMQEMSCDNQQKTVPFVIFKDDTTQRVTNFYFNGSETLMEKPYELNLEYHCYRKPGCILKKLLLYMSLVPTVRRIDRDKYIHVNNSNIFPDSISEFNKVSDAKLFDTGYDYGSIVHSSIYYRSYFVRPTFSTDISLLTFMTGQEYGLSFTDAKWLYKAFCSEECSQEIECKHGGFPNPDSCQYCECPNGYTGTNCENLEKSSDTCEIPQELEATSEKKSLFIKGKKTCNFEIKAPEGKKIKISIDSGSLTMYNPCFEKQAFEIKYRSDKSLTGLCLCGWIVDSQLESENNIVFIQYLGYTFNHEIKFYYQLIE